MRRLWNSGKCMHKVITLAPKLVVERGVSSSITSSAITPEPSEKNTELQTTDVTAWWTSHYERIHSIYGGFVGSCKPMLWYNRWALRILHLTFLIKNLLEPIGCYFYYTDANWLRQCDQLLISVLVQTPGSKQWHLWFVSAGTKLLIQDRLVCPV